MQELAAPKPQLLHPDTLLARAVRDPSDYARVKAAQLAARRAAEEREAARQAQADTIKRENLKAYKQFKAQVREMSGVYGLGTLNGAVLAA